MEELVSFDHKLFALINRVWTHPALDWFFANWTDFHKTIYFQALVLPLILILIYRNARWTGISFFFITAVVVAMCDGLYGKIVKPIFGRLRPPLAELAEPVIMRAPHFGGTSFPSVHSTNMFCLFAFASYFYPRLRWPLFIVACLTAYSRVYCGVHFPSDVTAGAVGGSVFGLIMAKIFEPLWKKIRARFDAKPVQEI